MKTICDGLYPQLQVLGGGVMRAALINAATRATVTGTRPLQRTI